MLEIVRAEHLQVKNFKEEKILILIHLLILIDQTKGGAAEGTPCGTGKVNNVKYFIISLLV